MIDKKPSVSNTGRTIGWMMAAGFEATRHMVTLKRDMKGFKQQALDYLEAEHPAHSYLEEDALRHSFVSAKMSQKYGPAFVAFLGFGNEAVRDISNTNTDGDRGMDLHNNKMGREFMAQNPDMDDHTLLSTFWEQIQDRTLISDLTDPRAVSRTYSQEDHLTAPVFENIMKYSAKLYSFRAFKLF